MSASALPRCPGLLAHAHMLAKPTPNTHRRFLHAAFCRPRLLLRCWSRGTNCLFLPQPSCGLYLLECTSSPNITSSKLFHGSENSRVHDERHCKPCLDCKSHVFVPAVGGVLPHLSSENMTCSPSSTQEELECSLFVYVRTWHWEGLELANSFIIPRAPIICYLYLSLTEKWAVRTSRLFLILSFSFSRHWSLQQSWLLQLETLSPVTTMSVKPLLRGFYKTCKRTNVHNLCFSHPCSNDMVVPKVSNPRLCYMIELYNSLQNWGCRLPSWKIFARKCDHYAIILY